MKSAFAVRLLPHGLLSLALAACGTTTFGVFKLEAQPPGTPESSVRALAGEPEHVVANDDGTRSLVYSTQPGGTQCFLMRFDKDGRLLATEDTLSEAGRDAIAAGMTREALLARMCKPIERLVTLHPYEVLSWNMTPLTVNQPRLFDVYLQNGRVLRTEVRTLYFQSGSAERS